jgi:perosamine synthetase
MNFIPVSEPNLSGCEREYVLDCLDSGWISSKGQHVELFESEFAKAVDATYAVATCNGTCALHLALLAVGIGPRDEVIVPTLTYIASANAVAYTGAKPVFVDSEPGTWNLDPVRVERAITRRTRAIMAVHLYGHPCDLDALRTIAKRHRLSLIEDAAEAIGSRYQGRPVGAIGDVGAFSFFGNKTITTGEGGMVVTNVRRFADRVRLLRGQGMSAKRYYYFETIGYNYRMTNVQAAIGRAQLESLSRFVQRKRDIAAAYSRLLAGVAGVTLPPEATDVLNTYWMYSILIEKKFGRSRDELMTHLRSAGVETRRFFCPCHSMPAYRRRGERHPIAEALSKKGINLPSSTKLTDSQIARVVEEIKSAAR